MVESYIILSVAIPIITILTGFIVKLHINRCHSMCCDSDCTKNPTINTESYIETPNISPINTPPTFKKDLIKIVSPLGLISSERTISTTSI